MRGHRDVEWNDPASAVTGYSGAELASPPPFDFVPVDDHVMTLDATERCSRTDRGPPVGAGDEGDECTLRVQRVAFHG
ncbi:PAS domain-containing protein [Haladaptatus salinisoli]|uniref:PAS domain-containing protein n=1 Tax=Haladaptatus salinisoli TaxID=2884876 RepID=UPI001D0A490F|nr:PAS domain-containing protein [Haladaptatus salinisoli]